MTRCLIPLLLSILLLLSGCSIFRNYDLELQQTNQQLQAGNVDGALDLLEQHNPWQDKDLLYYFEKGELLRAKGDLIGSQLAWRRADRVVFTWEESVKFDSAKYLAQFGSYLINDKVRRYEGYDYEKVMLTTQMAINHLALQDFDGARIEIKKTHEREALIAELRDKQYLQLEEQARNQGINVRYQDLLGYPVATLDAPEVLALKNSYQSAFSHYLAGYLYEALGEKALAAAGYRQAIELRPHTPLLEQALGNLDRASAKADESDLLIIVQNGLAPARGSVQLPVTVDIEGQPIPTLMSFPIMVADHSTSALGQISVDGRKQTLTALNSVSAMSRRALRDDMPGIILRTTYRAQSYASFQAQQLKKDPERAKERQRLNVLIEDADTRTWRTLPDTTQVTRLRLKKGQHRLTLGKTGELRFKLDQRYQVISLRRVGDQLFVIAPAPLEKNPLAAWFDHQ
ncbi:COG3014 family protein [Pseudomonas idahonensis]|uniref:COG3014 family protein n=1 Tax=Pseudomonas idahonensis TaxID=2942628 RepID=UPI0035C00DDF